MEFNRLGIDPLSSLDKLDVYLESHDLDYLLVVLSPDLSNWLMGPGSEIWQNLLRQNAGGTLLIARRSWESLTLDYPSRARLIELGEYLDLEGEGAPTLDKLLQSGERNHQLNLVGGGLGEYSLLSLEDLAKSLTQLAVTTTWHGKVVTLANPETTSYLSLAHEIAKGFKAQVQIKYVAGDDQPGTDYDWEQVLLEQAQYGLVISGSFHKELKNYIAKFLGNDKPPAPVLPSQQPESSASNFPPKPATKRLTPLTPSPRVTPKPTHDSKLVFVPLSSSKGASRAKLITRLRSWRPKPRTKTIHPLRNIVFRGLGIAAALYLGSLAFATTVVGLHLGSLKKALKEQNYTQLKPSPINAISATYLEANLVAFSSFPVIGQTQSLKDLTLLASLYSQSLKAISTADLLSTASKNVINYVLTDRGGDIAGYLSSARLYSEELYERLSYLDGSLPTDTPALIHQYDSQYHELKSSLVLLRRNLATGKALLSVAPNFIALGTKAKYAVLFQNNMELRGTGGFIGSFAILSFENGRLYDMPVYDVYAADGQLKGHVEPPAPIKNLLGEANWYLRDSNFDPDFPTSARRAEWFIKKTMNEDVSGTIGITLDLLKSLLHAVGPLDLPDYQETVSESNIYERAQFHAEVNFFPGSQAKKEYLSSVADALFSKLQSGGGADILKVVGALSSAVDSKDVQLSVLDPTAERVLSTLSWNGQVIDRPCPGGESCVKDYAYLVDSNFGVNKANYYVSRNISLTGDITKEGIPNHVLTVKYKNSATSTAWPAGAYKNYARLYLPPGTSLTSVKIDGRPLDQKDLTISSEHDKFVVGLLINVGIKSETELTVAYSLNQIVKPGSVYTWYYQRQPGTSQSDSVTVSLNYPLFLRPQIISPTAELSPQSLNFAFKNDTDHRVTIKFNP